MREYRDLPGSVQARIDELQPMVAGIVAEIEAKPELTQNHYGDYMAFLGDLAKDADHNELAVVAYAMVRAGGNYTGIRAALQIITGR